MNNNAAPARSVTPNLWLGSQRLPVDAAYYKRLVCPTMPTGSLGAERGARSSDVAIDPSKVVRAIRGGAPQLDDEERQREDAATASTVARIKAGEMDLFSELYERYFDRVYGYMRIVLRKSHEAEDGTQEVFIKAFKGLPRYESRGRPFRAWLFTIARNHAISMLRKRNDLPVESEQLDVHLENDRTNGASEELRWVSDSEFVLLIAQRQVLALRFMLDLSNSEIGEILDREPNAIRALQFRAIRTLKQRLAHKRPEPGRKPRERMRRWPKRAPVLRARRFALFH
jgi:RNA polymerase sigma-70 factor (ECF subfamily)